MRLLRVGLYEGLINSNDHVKFTHAKNVNNDIRITLDSTVDMNHFIIDREVILSANTTSNSGNQFKFINVIADDVSPNEYKVCTVKSIDINNNTVTLTRPSVTTSGLFDEDLSSSTDDYLVGFKNTFLIAKGRILV